MKQETVIVDLERPLVTLALRVPVLMTWRMKFACFLVGMAVRVSDGLVDYEVIKRR